MKKNKGKGGLLSNTMNAVAKRRDDMAEATGVPNEPVKRAKKRKAAPAVKNKNKRYTPPKKTKKQRDASLAAARQRQNARVQEAKKKDDYGTYE